MTSDFDEFYAATITSLMAQLHAYLGNETEAEDVVQEAYSRALARWSTVRHYDDPAGWVRRVAWNLGTSRFRRRKVALNFLNRQREEHLAGPTPDRVALVAALASISPQLRKAVVMHYVADLSIADIARQEGVAEGTVKSWLSRGRVALSEKLTAGRKDETCER